MLFLQSVITGLFVISLANSAKIVEFAGLRFTLGLVSISMAFCLIDVVNQLYGKADAQKSVSYAVLTRLILYPLAIPVVGWRVVLATEVVSLFTQLAVDIPIFDKLKQYRMWFFVRTNLSNFITSIIGAFLFILIAFLGVKPHIEQIIFGQIIMRWILSLAFSPITSIIVRLGKRA